MRAVGAAATRGVGAGAAASLVGVVETTALKFNAAGRERLGRRSAAARAHDLGGLGHGMLNLEHVAAARAFVIVARHNTSFSAQSGQITLPAKIQTSVTVPYIGRFITLRPRIYACCAGAVRFCPQRPQRRPRQPARSSCPWPRPVRSCARIASVGSEALSLTRKETGILEYLMLNQGRPVSQEELIEHVWDSSVNSFSNATRVHISSLRKKLRSALGYDPIRNRIGEGYVMEDGE